MRDSANITQLSELKPDYVGFIFYPHSKRYVGNPDIDLLSSISQSIKKTGVFVNEAMDKIADEVIKYNLDAVQLHGSESGEFCRSFRKYLQNMQTEKHVEIIKAFGLSEEFDFHTLADYEDFVDYFLFDTKTSTYGGSGLTFDWDILKQYHGSKPYFLSGGISEESIINIKGLVDARLYGVDLNSRFEIEPGIKDIDKLRSVFKLLGKSTSFDSGLSLENLKDARGQ
jgi:phosphoribosylanthranilate isomerase